MGHQAGQLVNPDEFDFYYPAVLSMTEREREGLEAWAEEEDDPEILELLPDKALLITARYEEQFMFIVCDGGDDAPVFYYCPEDVEEEVQEAHDSVFAYLEAMRANPHLLAGLNAYRGRLTYAAVAEAQDRDHVPADEALAA